MAKYRWTILIACIIILLSAASAFGDAYTNFYDISTGTITDLGLGYDSINYVHNSIAHHGYAAIKLTGDANVTLDSNLKSINISASPNTLTNFNGISVYGVGNPTPTPFGQGPSLTITADKFTITNSIENSRAIDIQEGSTLLVEGALEVTQNGSGAAVVIGYRSQGTFGGKVDITTTKPFSSALTLSHSAVVTLEDVVNLKTDADNSWVLASDSGTLVAKENVDIKSSGDYSKGIYTTGNDNFTFEKNLKIETSGDLLEGILLQFASYIKVLGDLSVSVDGYSDDYYGGGIIGYDDPSRLSLQLEVVGKTDVMTKGDNTNAIYFQGSKAILGETVSKTEGDNAYGIQAAFATIVLGKSTITTLGDNSHAVASIASFSYPTYPSSSIVFEGPVEITTSGILAVGAYANVKSNITSKDITKITTSGASGHGVYVASEGSVDFKKNANIKTTGNQAHGLYLTGGEIHFHDSGSIIVEGTGADAIVFVNPSFSSFKSVYVESKQNAAISNTKEQDVVAVFKGKSEVHGYILNYQDSSTSNYGTFLLDLYDDSFWQGSTFIPGSGEVNLNLNDNAAWKISMDLSYVNSVTMADNSRIIFSSQSNSFYRAHIDELSGKGILVLRADMSLSGRGDLLNVKNISGAYKLDVQDLTQGEGGLERLIVITSENVVDALEITLYTGKSVRLGAYSYALESSSDQLIWELVKKSIDDSVIDGSTISAIGIGEFSKAVDSSLSDELLISKDGLWAVLDYKLQKLTTDISQDMELRQDIYGMTIGVDVKSTGNFALGFFTGVNVGDQNAGDLITGDIIAFTVGTKLSYEKSNFYLSGYIRGSNYFYRLNISDSSGELLGVATTSGLSASVQIMNKFYISDSNLYIAPKGKVSYTYIADFSHNFGVFEMSYSAANNLVAWLGFRMGSEKYMVGNTIKVYLEAGFIHDFNPESKVIIEDERITVLEKNCLQVGFGFDHNLGSDATFSFEFKSTFGKDFSEPIKLKFATSTIF